MRKAESSLTYRFISTWILLLCLADAGQAQETIAPVDTSARAEKVHIDFAERMLVGSTDTADMVYLLGSPGRSVELRQDTTYMYCDSAVVINERDVRAFGNVIIQRGEHVQIYADRLDFYGQTQQANLFGEVLLNNDGDQLWTTRLFYDLERDVGYYDSTAVMINDSAQVSSKVGYYWVQDDIARFIDSVVVIGEQVTLLTDSLMYRANTQVAEFLGPTLILQDSAEIYCEDGFYDVPNQNAEFRQEAEYWNGDQHAWADTIRYTGAQSIVDLRGDAHFVENDREVSADLIRYFEKSGETRIIGNAVFRDSLRYAESELILYNRITERLKTVGRSMISEGDRLIEADTIDYDQESGQGFARGEVVFRDTAAQTTVISEFARYNQKTEFVKAYGIGRPLLKTLMDDDTMYLTADTLVFETYTDTITRDSFQRFFGFPDVRILRGTMQGVCDSITFDARDSMFHLLVNPAMWSDTTQFTADTIRMLVRNDVLDQIFLRQNAFITSIVDQQFYDQIKGRNIHGKFQEEALEKLDVTGNAESIYYIKNDDDAFIGVNQIAASEIFFTFADSELDQIRFITKPTGKMVPMDQANHGSLRLDGFVWNESRRPKELPDLFAK